MLLPESVAGYRWISLALPNNSGIYPATAESSRGPAVCKCEAKPRNPHPAVTATASASALAARARCKNRFNSTFRGFRFAGAGTKRVVAGAAVLGTSVGFNCLVSCHEFLQAGGGGACSGTGRIPKLPKEGKKKKPPSWLRSDGDAKDGVFVGAVGWLCPETRVRLWDAGGSSWPRGREPRFNLTFSRFLPAGSSKFVPVGEINK